MYISNNCESFHFWWKENLVKHQEVSKILWKWWSAKFSFAFYFFIQLLKTVIFRQAFTLSFQKNVLKQTWKSFNQNSRNSHPEVFCETVVLRNLAKQAKVLFSCEFCEISNTFFDRKPPVTASELHKYQILEIWIRYFI